MKSQYSIWVLALVAFVLLGTTAALPPQQMTITDGPRIEDVSNHSAEIAWTTSFGGSSVIHYGTDPNNLNQTAESPYAQSGTGSGQHGMHRVRIDNLQPNTTYYFVVESGQGQGNGSEVKSQVGQFTTQGSGTSDKVPLYRAYSASTGSHLFTPSYAEYNKYISGGGYSDEGVAGYVLRKESPGTEPMYRLFNSTINDHLYTNTPDDRDRALRAGYTDEGIVGYMSKTQQPGTVPLYRLRNSAKQHFYTADPNERQRDLQQGWQDEGLIGYIWSH